jgi:hypothetical protein
MKINDLFNFKYDKPLNNITTQTFTLDTSLVIP